MGKTSQMTGKVSSVVGKLSNSIFIKTLMGGMMAGFPASMAGSFASILMSLQIPIYQQFLEATGLKNVFNIIIMCTVNLAALFPVFGVAYTYAKEKKQDPLPAGIIALASFLVITPFTATPTEWGTVNYSIPTTWLGGQGLFSALIVGFLVGAMYSFIKKKGWTIKLPDSVPPVISSSFAGIIPGVLIISIFAVISEIFTKTSFGSVHQAIYSVLQMPIQGIGTNIWAGVLAALIVNLLWMVGIHGGMVVLPVVAVAWGAADLANLNAFNAGQVPPNIMGNAFYLICTFAGTGLGLAINMLFAKSKRYRTLGKLAVIPAAFGINEPLKFGTPIVMNFRLFIPQVFMPVISLLLGYFATVIGIIPKMSGVGMPAGTPLVLQGLLQGSWKIAVFQLFLTVVWIGCWYPFFKIMDKEAFQQEQVEVQENQEAV